MIHTELLTHTRAQERHKLARCSIHSTEQAGWKYANQMLLEGRKKKVNLARCQEMGSLTKLKLREHSEFGLRVKEKPTAVMFVGLPASPSGVEANSREWKSTESYGICLQCSPLKDSLCECIHECESIHMNTQSLKYCFDHTVFGVYRWHGVRSAVSAVGSKHSK